MIIDTCGCLHGSYPELEGGDLLIVTGDLTYIDHLSSGWLHFEQWLLNQKYTEKIIVSGNHDNFLQSMDEHRMWKYWDKLPGVSYLCDSETVFYEPLTPNMPDGKVVLRPKIWGSPWTKTFEGMNPKCKAFTVDTEEELEEKWKLIPDDVEILITHSPPYGILDEIQEDTKWGARKFHVGSKSLIDRIPHLKNLKLHVFSHVHEGYGHEIIRGIHFVNCSHLNADYKPVNKPIRIEL